VVRIEQVRDPDLVIAASHLFDAHAQSTHTQRFLDEPGHHLLLAFDDSRRPVGMVSGVEMTHPDKGTEMFLYELGVEEGRRGEGIGTALVTALASLARQRQCYGMWVLTDADNAPAMATYRTAGGVDPSPTTMITWTFD